MEMEVDTWICVECEMEWAGEEGDGNRWSECDTCHNSFHLQFSGIQYLEAHYYKVDLSGNFHCATCNIERNFSLAILYCYIYTKRFAQDVDV